MRKLGRHYKCLLNAYKYNTHGQSHFTLEEILGEITNVANIRRKCFGGSEREIFHKEVKKGVKLLDSQQKIQSLQGQSTDATLQKRTTSKTYI
jgi:hypothetical protein